MTRDTGIAARASGRARPARTAGQAWALRLTASRRGHKLPAFAGAPKRPRRPLPPGRGRRASASITDSDSDPGGRGGPGSRVSARRQPECSARDLHGHAAGPGSVSDCAVTVTSNSVVTRA